MSSSTNQASNSSSKILKSKIEKLVFGGAGLSRDQGFIIFVPYTAPGDLVEVTITQEKKNYKFAKLHRLIQSGPQRTSPRCPYYSQCGGCQLQHLTPEGQLEAKRTFLEDAFGPVPPLVPSPEVWHYRSHIRLNLENGSFGFKNNGLIEIDSCSLFLPIEHDFFRILRQHLQNLSESGSFRVFKATPSHFVLAFSFPKRLPKARRHFVKTLMEALPLQGISMKSPSGEEHFGKTTISNIICGLPVSFSPYGFMQNNPFLTPRLYETLVDWARPEGKSILDLYSGVGITSLLLSRAGGSVIGVEESAAAIRCAQENQNQSGILGVQFKLGRVEEILKTARPVDLVIVNPPKTGLSKSVRDGLLRLQPTEILYISCMPTTLKRDLNDLIGYKREKILGFDLFPQTTHLETLVKITRNNFK
ncbi:uncharacterized RNA methyltransferase pc0248 [Simkania negevensis Z]|uniref:Uncharacterized RNA methyltransferase pc0248 n=2 Tax=Simkania negevensis TaxID=83561 RepID=F8L649_SIMNZ|nr:uncharacterized RNA methyltransferase pc0248 [Simkania negevensis Z]